MEAEARDDLAVKFGEIVSEAAHLILAIPASAIGATKKPDGSPVSRADVEAEKLILARLETAMAGVPVIAEESFAPSGSAAPAYFLLVDPLDGTREFVAGNKDYTVNIALIEAGVPIVGAICAPAYGEVFVGGAKAFQGPLAPPGALRVAAIKAGVVPPTGLRAVVSRSHLEAQTEQWMREHKVTKLERIGSSLKFCVLARGDADVYPRLAPTMEWDTAAGHAILTAAGGCVLDQGGAPLAYGKARAGFKNAGFIAWGRKLGNKS
jgi:3'(2'), 5'-bisphosphate nucleotidase